VSYRVFLNPSISAIS